MFRAMLFVCVLAYLAFGQANAVVRNDAGTPTITPVIKAYTVATLPSPSAGMRVEVTDGASATDCTTGGGATRVPCRYDGTAWVLDGGGGGGGIGGTLGSTDNAVPKADGTGGSTLQASSLNIPDNHNWTLNDVPQPRVVWSAQDTTGTTAAAATTVLSFSVPAGLLAVGDTFEVIAAFEKEDTDVSSTLSNFGYQVAVDGGGLLAAQGNGAPVQAMLGARVWCHVGTAGWICKHERTASTDLQTNGTDVLTGAWTLNINVTNSDTTDTAFARRVQLVVYK